MLNARILKAFLLAIAAVVFILSSVGHVLAKEVCVSFNPETAEVKRVKGNWKIVDGNHLMFDFGKTAQGEVEALRSLVVVKHYRVDNSCFVGRPDPSFYYLLKHKAAPSGLMRGEDCVSFNPNSLEVKHINSDWKIVDGSHWVFSFGAEKKEAQTALNIIKHYKFAKSCFVGRPDPSFQYLRK